MKPILQRVKRELDQLQEIDRFRQVKSGTIKEEINLSTNSYLNLEKSRTVQERAANLLTSYAGNGASRLVHSSSPLFEKLEQKIASWKGCEAALLFNSGYAANTGILQSLGRKGAEIFSDRLNHASIVDGIRLSGAKMIRYKHCDTDDLAKRLSHSSATEKIIVTDSIFSMDGDIAPLADIADLGQQHGAITMVDEAHSTGLYGEYGSGLVEALNLSDVIDIKMGTLSKTVAGTGGFFAGSQLLKSYFVNSARSFIFSTALAESNLAWNLAAIEEIVNQKELRDSFKQRVEGFLNALNGLQINTGRSETAIIPLLVKTDQEALNLSAYLKEKGFIAPAIRPPTVPQGTSRVRLTLHAGLDGGQLATLLTQLKEYFLG